MRCGSPTRALAIAAILVLAAVSPGCERPPDEAWLRFLGFEATSGSGENAVTTTVSFIEGQLLDGTTETADAGFENVSTIVGTGTGGTGIFVGRVRVEYRLPGLSPPSYEYPVSLYLPAASGVGEKRTVSTGTISGIPIVPASLKDWIVHHTSDRVVEFAAQATFFAEADEGTDLETGGGIAVILSRE